MKVVWRPMAEADRESIFDYIAQDNPGAALDLERQRPTLYKPGRVKGTREIVVRPNYVMVYRVEDDGGTLCVLRVLHAAQKWP